MRISKALSRILNLDRPAKRAIQMIADSALIILCFAVAMALRLESFGFARSPFIWIGLLPVFPVTLFIFARFGLYRAIIRYITGQALTVIVIGVAASSITLYISSRFVPALVPRSVPGIYALLLFLSVSGLRLWMRIIFINAVKKNRVPVLIYGAGDAGRQLASALFYGTEYEASAFLDDNKDIQGSSVAGKQVFSSAYAEKLIKERNIKAIFLAMPSINRTRRREIVAALEPLGVKVKTVPGMADIVAGRAKFDDLRSVTPEDLLGRDPVPPRPALMSYNITGKVVLISGAGGSIGSELCRQIIDYAPAALVLLDVSEFALYSVHTELVDRLAQEGQQINIEPVLGSVQNPGRIRAILRGFGVQTVYHAAAYKHVTLVEQNIVEGVRNNVFGTKVIAEASAEMGVENFIMISTDKAVRPTNFMGASKRMAELVCQSLAQEQSRTTFSMVRFGNVLGSSGSVIPRFRAQIEAGGPVTVTHKEITRFFMTIPEAAQLVIQAGALAQGGDVFVLDMGEPIKILNLAMTMVRLHGLKPVIMNKDETSQNTPGTIPIDIIGINKGEKLYEELLIGSDPHKTEHPRIMSATEAFLPHAELEVFLENLLQACYAFDVAKIRQIFLDAPLSFIPASNEIHDLMWKAAARDETHPYT